MAISINLANVNQTSMNFLDPGLQESIEIFYAITFIFKFLDTICCQMDKFIGRSPVIEKTSIYRDYVHYIGNISIQY